MKKSLLLAVLVPVAAILAGSLGPWSTCATASAPVFGPPAVCIPLEIGTDETIPDAFNVDFTPAELVSRMSAVLDGSPRTLVHMETLRRAVWAILASDRDMGDAGRTALGHALLSRLRWRLVETLTAEQTASERELGLAWFDLAFMQGALEQSIRLASQGEERAMDEALARLDGDAAALFGCALASWHRDQRSPQGYCANYLAAFALNEGADPDLSASLLRVGQRLHGESEREGIIAELQGILGER